MRIMISQQMKRGKLSVVNGYWLPNFSFGWNSLLLRSIFIYNNEGQRRQSEIFATFRRPKIAPILFGLGYS